MGGGATLFWWRAPPPPTPPPIPWTHRSSRSTGLPRRLPCVRGDVWACVRGDVWACVSERHSRARTHMSGRRRPARELRVMEDGPPLLFPLSLFYLSHLETAGAARGVRWPASGQRHGGACALGGGLRATTRKRKEKWPGERKRRAPTPSPPPPHSREKKKRVGRFARARLGGSPHAHTQPRSPRRARRAPAAGPSGPLCAWIGARTGAGAAISVRTHTEGKKNVVRLGLPTRAQARPAERLHVWQHRGTDAPPGGGLHR